MDTNPVSPPDPARYALLQTVCQPFALEQLAEHVAAVSAHQRRVYVDRRVGGYTWSFVHGGGPYPLLRSVASFIGYPYTKLIVGGRAVGDRWCVMIGPDGDDNPVCEAWAVLELTSPISAPEALARIRGAVGPRAEPRPDREPTVVDVTVDDPVALADEVDLTLRHAHVAPLAAELAVLLERLVRDRYTSLVVEVDDVPSRYVQFLTHDGTSLIAESVSDCYLDADDARPLTDRERIELVRLGWNEPDGTERGHGNYWRCWTPPDIGDAAQLGALTLVRVHGLDRPDGLTATADRCPPSCGKPDDVRGPDELA